MQRQPVESACIASVGYDANSLTLEVQFNKGTVYQYLGVPPSTHTSLVTAASIGKYLNSQIKGRHAFQRNP